MQNLRPILSLSRPAGAESAAAKRLTVVPSPPHAVLLSPITSLAYMIMYDVDRPAAKLQRPWTMITTVIFLGTYLRAWMTLALMWSSSTPVLLSLASLTNLQMINV